MARSGKGEQREQPAAANLAPKPRERLLSARVGNRHGETSRPSCRQTGALIWRERAARRDRKHDESFHRQRERQPDTGHGGAAARLACHATPPMPAFSEQQLNGTASASHDSLPGLSVCRE